MLEHVSNHSCLQVKFLRHLPNYFQFQFQDAFSRFFSCELAFTFSTLNLVFVWKSTLSATNQNNLHFQTFGCTQQYLLKSFLTQIQVLAFLTEYFQVSVPILQLCLMTFLVCRIILVFSKILYCQIIPLLITICTIFQLQEA